MPSDYIVYLFYSWIGLILICLHAGAVAGIWVLIVKPKSSGLGMSPLVVGAVMSAGIMLALAFFSASFRYADFGASERAGFWNTVPGWTAYLFALFASVSALALTIVGVPATAI